MSKLFLAINTTGAHIILQGIRMLIAENDSHKSTIAKRMVPGDQNIITLMEYYIKRSIQLKNLQEDLQSYIDNFSADNKNSLVPHKGE